MAMRGARWVTAGLADQAVMATANAANTLLAVGLLESKARAGTMLLSLSLGYFVLNLNRAFVGDVLLAQVSRLEGRERDRLVRHGLAAAVTVGCLAALILIGIWLCWRRPGTNIDLQDLIWLAPFLPVILLHDTGRYTYLSEREPVRALVIDLIWVGVQATMIAFMIVSGHVRPGLLLASWGVGACVGASAYLIRSGVRPWRGDPRRWLAETRHLSGWFTATNLIGQIQVQAVGFLVAGRLTTSELAVLRSGQTALLQPVQNFVTAMMGLLVPRSSRLAGTGDVPRLRRQTVRVAAGFAGLAVLMVAVVVPLAGVLRPHLGRFADMVPLALPISIQAGVYLLQIPFTAAIRGMQRAHGHLRGATWGLTFGAAIGLLAMIALYVWAARRPPHDRDNVNEVVASTSPEATTSPTL
jgi:O-antigen/teichoic acid export membrane protein